jgi:predicted DNA-binding transcriptional regulator AlpA
MGIFESMMHRLDAIEAKVDALADAEPQYIQTEANHPKWLDTKGAANHVGMSQQSLALYRSKGSGPAFSKVGSTVRYDREDLDAWLKANSRWN